MNLSIRAFEALVKGEKLSSLHFLLYWRLILIPVTLGAFLVWDNYYQGHIQWARIIIVFALYLAWSVLLLISGRFQHSLLSEFRELSFDLIVVFSLVLLSGRSENPYIYYSFVVVAFAAVVLKPRRAWLLCLASVVAYTWLIALDVQQHFAHFPQNYKTHLVGMWLNFIASSCVICFFVSQLVAALRQQQKTITRYREKNLKNEQLIGLATVAASAVHNLATPLSTLKLYVDDLSAAGSVEKEKNNDFKQMSNQLRRCQDSIDELALLAQKSDSRKSIKVESLVSDLSHHYALMYPDAPIDLESKNIQNVELSCTPLLHYALVNLINNALESAISDVKIFVVVEKSNLIITITNTTREVGTEIIANWGSPVASQKSNGLGIGSMLANTTIEQHQGGVVIQVESLAAEDSLSEVTVRITLPVG